jgi:hypothetical protein
VLTWKYIDGGTPTVRPEPVEGLSFSFSREREGEGFDKLSPNGFGWFGLPTPRCLP